VRLILWTFAVGGARPKVHRLGSLTQAPISTWSAWLTSIPVVPVLWNDRWFINKCLKNFEDHTLGIRWGLFLDLAVYLDQCMFSHTCTCLRIRLNTQPAVYSIIRHSMSNSLRLSSNRLCIAKQGWMLRVKVISSVPITHQIKDCNHETSIWNLKLYRQGLLSFCKVIYGFHRITVALKHSSTFILHLS